MAATWVGLALMAVAVSLDGFAAGVSYGLRQIRLSTGGLWVTGLLSGVAVFFLGSAGQALALAIGSRAGHVVGGLVLIGLGLWSLREAQRPALEPGPAETSTIWSFRLRPLGLVIQILREPARADLDRSGWISPVEALLLGVALALDAAGVGLGAGLTGFSPWPAALAVMLTNVAFLRLGTWFGHLLAGRGGELAAVTGLLPGVILAGMGLWRLF